MKEQIIEGIRVFEPQTAEELAQAVEAGRPFIAPDNLADAFGLPRDPHLIDGEDVGVLDDIDGE